MPQSRPTATTTRGGAAATLAHIISAIMFIGMAATLNIGHTVDDILSEIREQIQVLLPR